LGTRVKKAAQAGQPKNYNGVRLCSGNGKNEKNG